MEILLYSKMQLTCLVILMAIGIQYIRAGRGRPCNKFFDWAFILAEFELVFDGLTAYTVNNLDFVPRKLNLFLHLCFFASISAFLYVILLYILNITKTRIFPKSTYRKCFLFIPLAVNFVSILIFLPKLEFKIGTYSNYSAGLSALIAMGSTLGFVIGSFGVIISRHRYIEIEKQRNIVHCIFTAIFFMVLEYWFPEFLCSSLGVTLLVISIYVNIESPAIKTQENYHNEMLTGFATMVENRDDNTGGHIRRTTAYVSLIVEEMQKRGMYKRLINKDYINSLEEAAPMHDIGKVAIPDSILQKPGKLTDEEYAIMKTHSERGGEIIKSTFGKIISEHDHSEIIYKVARYHHEKWNGRGYPEGIRENQIPLCARIMAVADVFDAVSAKRVYRDAMPLDQCFEIIKKGSGTDFDPEIADLFLELRPKIEEIYHKTFG